MEVDPRDFASDISIHKALAGLDGTTLQIYTHATDISIHKALAGLDGCDAATGFCV